MPGKCHIGCNDYCEMVPVVDPMRFVSVTDAGMTAFTSPCTVKGCVSTKMLPYGLLVGSENQLPNRVLTSTVMDEAVDCRLWPEAALKLNTAWVISRAVE